MAKAETKKGLSQEQREDLIKTLKSRFEKNMKRHNGLDWDKVREKLDADSENVFVYHNGAQSYYSGRGFRGSLRV